MWGMLTLPSCIALRHASEHSNSGTRIACTRSSSECSQSVTDTRLQSRLGETPRVGCCLGFVAALLFRGYGISCPFLQG